MLKLSSKLISENIFLFSFLFARHHITMGTLARAGGGVKRKENARDLKVSHIFNNI